MMDSQVSVLVFQCKSTAGLNSRDMETDLEYIINYHNLRVAIPYHEQMHALHCPASVIDPSSNPCHRDKM